MSKNHYSSIMGKIWNMKTLLCLAIIINDSYAAVYSKKDWIYDPQLYYPPRIVNGTDMPTWRETPDYRIKEDTWYAYAQYFYKEEERPYRISPHFKQTRQWAATRPMFSLGHKENPHLLGCYCSTVFKKYTTLAGCAVITTRHLLTTATSTELVLKDYGHEKYLDSILGAWYDHNADVWNSSMYMVPARIHYHPKYIHPYMVNTSHPLPFTFDLSVWAATHPFIGTWYWPWGARAAVCQRGGSATWQYMSSTPRYWDLAHIVGFQYMKAFRRVTNPFLKYVVRTRRHTVPCPKTEWGWMHCLPANWAKFGIESGAAWHRALEGRYWTYDGLIGLCVFSLHLRSESLTHYFQVINSHPVLDFLYGAYMGRLPYRYLDYRFQNTQWRAPVPKGWAYVANYHVYGSEHNYGHIRNMPWYKK